MLDLKKLTIAEDFEDGLKGKKVFDVVRCDKPQPNEWFRLFKLGDKGFDNFIKVVITEQEDARGEKQSYLLSPEIANTYKDYLKPYHRAVLAYGYTSRGIIFIWPVKYNPEYPNLWNETAQKIAIAACNEWTQIQSDRVQKCYTHLKMTEKNEREGLIRFAVAFVLAQEIARNTKNKNRARHVLENFEAIIKDPDF